MATRHVCINGVGWRYQNDEKEEICRKSARCFESIHRQVMLRTELNFSLCSPFRSFNLANKNKRFVNSNTLYAVGNTYRRAFLLRKFVNLKRVKYWKFDDMFRYVYKICGRTYFRCRKCTYVIRYRTRGEYVPTIIYVIFLRLQQFDTEFK